MDKSSPLSSHHMEGSDNSMSLSALADSGDVSAASALENSTDLSYGGANFKESFQGQKKKKLKTAYERKQFLHDIQLLRIELSQKSLVIDNLKAQHMSKVEELEEKLHDIMHQKQILQAKLESALAIQQDDARKRQEQTQKELKIILDRQRELEQTNRRLQSKASNIRDQLQRDSHVTESEYIELKSQSVDDMSIADYFAMRLFEMVQPMKIECENLRTQRDQLSANVAKTSHTLHSCEQELMQERRNRSHAQVQLEATKNDLEITRKGFNENTGKAQRFDAVLEERNRLDRNYSDLSKKQSYLEAEHQNLHKQLIELRDEKDKMQQVEQLLRQDKEYLTRNLSDCTIKLESCEDTLKRTQDQLERAKTAREELYEKYAASRDEARLVYERRLQTELDRIRLQTENELDKLRADSKTSYERENRSLREARDLAIQERDQLCKLRDDAEKRCEGYADELRKLEASVDARLSDYQNEARVKTFELDRLQRADPNETLNSDSQYIVDTDESVVLSQQGNLFRANLLPRTVINPLVHEESCKNLERVQNENERLSKKLEIVTTDYGEMQRETTATETQLRTTLRDLQSRLTAYEKLEQEMDDVVMQAAEVEVGDGTRDPSEAERVLFSYGYGANVPTTSKRRMKQSVHLARRVLQLEKVNTSLQADIQRREEEMKEVCNKLKTSNKLLEESHQPYSYLIESMRKRDEEAEKQRNHVLQLEECVGSLKSENAELRETKRLMSSDLDRLLGHRQEIALIKRVVANMASPGRSGREDKNFLASLESRQKSTPAPEKGSPRLKGHGKKMVDDESSFCPGPLVFTKCPKSKVNPERYRKMKELTRN